MDEPRTPLWRLSGPRYWPVWLAIGLVRALNLLPLGLQLRFGRLLGRTTLFFSRRDRHIADVNIRLCLPELDEAARQRLIREHFESLGCGLLETGLVWWAGDERLRRLVRFEGEEHLRAAVAAGRGALLLSAHFTVLEIGARAAALLTPVSIMYQTPRNALIAELSRRGRSRHAVQAIASDQVRDLLQNLKSGLPVWYAPDQRFTDRNSAPVPFFGHPADSSLATSRLARISRAPVLPYFPERLADDSGYLVRIGAPLEDHPSDDPVADALRYHALIEAQVRRCPAQYLWIYKRFKRPGPGGDPYR